MSALCCCMCDRCRPTPDGLQSTPVGADENMLEGGVGREEGERDGPQMGGEDDSGATAAPCSGHLQAEHETAE